MIGKHVAHYTITEKIGAGGMGDVYRARDNKLGRDVALKVLPDAFAADPQRMARFKREAQILASLNHPNIAAIHGVEDTGDVRCLVLELVEGETLASLVERGAIAVDEALDIVVQIARALESAHEKGIIHRDLKPANVIVGADGGIKVLDFGLAKALADDTATTDSELVTLSPTATRAGVILGTAAYMSPEQATGKEVDRRADIWAFGVVLLELLTGRSIFRRETVSETMAAVLMTEPDLEELPRETPVAIRELLARCLRKDPMSRLRDIGDARIHIEEARNGPEPSVPASAAPRPSATWAFAAMTLVAVGLSWALWNRSERADQPTLRFQQDPEVILEVRNGNSLALSRDGKHLAYVVRQGADPDGCRIYLRDLEDLAGAPVNGTQNARLPFFSPDGQWLGFSASGQLKKVPVTGGTPEVVCDACAGIGASWGSDGSIVFGGEGGLFRVPSSGGTPERLTTLEPEETQHLSPRHLPTGDVVFTVRTESRELSVHALSVPTGKRQRLIQGAAQARYLPTGHLVFLRDRSLYSMPFDPVRLVANGPPVVVVERVEPVQLWGLSAAHFDVSDTGTLVYLAGARNFVALVSVDRGGGLSSLAEERLRYMQPRFSPDGRRLALLMRDSNDVSDIWLYDLARGAMSRLTYSEEGDITPVWSPDGAFVAFASRRENVLHLYRKPADGSGEEERLSVSDDNQHPTDWSPDGKHLAFSRNEGMEVTSPSATNRNVYVLPADGDGEPTAFVDTPFDESDASFSPNGDFLAYRSDESGRYEVYVRPFPGPGAKTQVSTEGGQFPLWNPAGGEIFYQVEAETDGAVRLMVAEYRIDSDTFLPAKPRELFRGPFTMGPRAEYDVSPDGERFVMLRREDTNRTPLTFVVNWFEELKRLVPIQ